MSSHFDLVVSADPATLSAELILLDENGRRLAGRRTDFRSIPAGRLQALFDLENYLRYYVEWGREAETIARTGVSIAEEVLGEEIFLLLWRARNRRTLRVRLPGATEREDLLAAALARLPWEIARPSAAGDTLAERNLLVRVVHDMAAPATEPLALGTDECLRVLFVFAQAGESEPLAARLEQNRLRELLEREIYPTRRVEGHFLTHGVTRQRLEAQVAEHGGYHVVHWSGHGHRNRLVLAKPGGERDFITGEELLEVFVHAGGFIPRLFFLSACHSGDILRVKSWGDFLAVARGDDLDARRSAPPPTRDILVEDPPGYTGTAHALLQGGVPSVVAMRYSVGDDYARELAVEFYSALLAHAQPKSAAAALTMARRALLNPAPPGAARFAAADHATPVLYGEEEPGLVLRPGRSPSLNTRRRRLQRVAELTTAEHAHFVGRTRELTGLGAEFIGSGAGAEVRPVAVVTGLGGMGKTALVAEALALWEDRFDWVLLYQFRGASLDFENTLRDIHLNLAGELGRYHAHVGDFPADAVFRPVAAGFGGDERLDRLTENLLRVMRDEAILLVLDNFETVLAPVPETAASHAGLRNCRDPAWDRFLRRLATELVGTRSRVLVTCRHPLAALAGTPSHAVPLGPLSPGEAALYLRQHTGLREMAFSAEERERTLVRRLLGASRFHPLLMDRLARLAMGGTELRPQLLRGLETLERRGDFSKLPELFAARGNARETAYLEDALAVSLDQLIRAAGPDARRLLWIISLANEPVPLALVNGVWSGESVEQEQLRGLKEMLDQGDALPPELQARLETMPLELRAKVDAVPLCPQRSAAAPILDRLLSTALVDISMEGPEDPNPDLSCHELVRERIHAWMCVHAEERGTLTATAVRLAYAERLEASFELLREQDVAAAVAAGSEALVYCVQAGAYDQLAGFASRLVNSRKDPRILQGLLSHLESAASSAPEGEARWSCMGFLADAMNRVGRHTVSLQFYEQADLEARAAVQSGGSRGRRAWADVAWIAGNWAFALRQGGDLEAARSRHLESADADRRAGSPAVAILSSEMEALRVRILQGGVDEAVPEIQSRLEQVQAWWHRYRSGHRVPEAPDPEILTRAFIGALDVAMSVDHAREDWRSMLQRANQILEAQISSNRSPEEVLSTRMNRAGVLGRMQRFSEAQAELEACLIGFEDDPVRSAQVLGLLAEMFDANGDVSHAIAQERRSLALRDQLEDPRDRAISHNNLAIWLGDSSDPSAVRESSFHRVAAMVYRVVAGLTQDLEISWRNYDIGFRRAAARGEFVTIPQISELLARPAFQPLDEWLRERGVDLAGLQESVDRLLDEVRRRTVAEAPTEAGSHDPTRSGPS